jgi:tryptophan synthase beta chain
MRDPGRGGRYGDFGGRFVPESLVPACQELEAGFTSAWADPAFRSRLDGLLCDYVGRPTPVTECGRLSQRLGIRLLLKREDLAHTGSHKINNVLGQALLAERMGKRPRPVPASTVSRLPPRRLCSASSASSTWAPSTSSAKA